MTASLRANETVALPGLGVGPDAGVPVERLGEVDAVVGLAVGASGVGELADEDEVVADAAASAMRSAGDGHAPGRRSSRRLAPVARARSPASRGGWAFAAGACCASAVGGLAGVAAVRRSAAARRRRRMRHRAAPRRRRRPRRGAAAAGPPPRTAAGDARRRHATGRSLDCCLDPRHDPHRQHPAGGVAVLRRRTPPVLTSANRRQPCVPSSRSVASGALGLVASR